MSQKQNNLRRTKWLDSEETVADVSRPQTSGRLFGYVIGQALLGGRL